MTRLIYEDGRAKSCGYRSVASCQKKCVPTDYREADLNKAESVCLDRCMAKFVEVNMQISEKLKEKAPGGGAGGGGMFGV